MTTLEIAPGKTRIGWIGTGVMGRSMCGHLIAKGFQATVYNRSQAKARDLLDKGAAWAASPKAVAEKSDVIFSIVGFPADVQEVLLGENGATRVFGPQKGASKTDLDNLERALTRLADVVATEFGFDYRNQAGAGAAGGLGFGLLSFCGATIRPGFEVVAEAVALESKMKDADVVITGEGSLDRQTLEGKTPAGVAR